MSSNTKQNHDLDYNVLKTNVIKACFIPDAADKLDFSINHEKLLKSTDDIGLVPVKVNLNSNMVTVESIPAISEFFKAQKLSWFDGSKNVATIVFVKKENINDKCQELINCAEVDTVENPDVDAANALATILAEYPCYLCMIVSYLSNDPMRQGRTTYMASCRANMVAIQQEQYKYNHQDI